VRQYLASGFYPSGTAKSSDSMNPSGSLIKAMLICSALDLTGRWDDAAKVLLLLRVALGIQNSHYPLEGRQYLGADASGSFVPTGMGKDQVGSRSLFL